LGLPELARIPPASLRRCPLKRRVSDALSNLAQQVAGLSALMALLFVLALVIPLLRRFYELRPPTLGSAGAWAVGSAVGVGGMVVALRLFSSWVYGMHRADGQAAETDQAELT
jgi:hypothetical protein